MCALLFIAGAYVALMASCTNATSEQSRPAELRDVTTLGSLTHPDLTEASGVVRSSKNENVFWSQNDSGNEPQLFAYDSTGASLGVARVPRTANRDWEALSTGPCSQGTCIYIGDTGDNRARRAFVVVYRVAEPNIGDSVSAPPDSIRVRYPDGAHDVEAMWVAPDTSLWLVTKRPMFAPGGGARPVQLFRVAAASWGSTAIETATLIDSLPIVPLTTTDGSWVTDASLSAPDTSGIRHVAIRTMSRVYVFSANGATGRPGALQNVCSTANVNLRQSEGITWLSDGRLLLNSEGRGSPLIAGRCP